jgi:hypothetical protein
MVRLSRWPMRQRGHFHTPAQGALFDCNMAMMAELALTEIAHPDRKGNTYQRMIE